MFFISQNKAECCGCGACSAVCPKKAIEMKRDPQGFLYPEINQELCIDCGLCRKVCIFKENFKTAEEKQEYYAIRAKDEDVVRSSSSGGFFTLMAEEIFARGGIVYGVAYDENFRVVHQRAEDMAQAEAFRTSKYVQSDNTQLFDSVSRDLEEGKTVLVTGTPCQIAGITAALKSGKKDTSRLYTCDNICHGVTSPRVFDDYMQSLNRYIPQGDPVASVNMRAKKQPSSKTVLEVRTRSGKTLECIKDYSYYRLYFSRNPVRPSCFACKFTSYNRAGDLSAADFWNSSESSFDFDTSWGINEVLVNTDKGRELFAAVCKNAYYKAVTAQQAWQPHLEYTTQKPESYDDFWKEYLSAEDKETVMRKYVKVSPLFKLINFATPILRKLGLYSLFGKLYKVVFVKKNEK